MINIVELLTEFFKTLNNLFELISHFFTNGLTNNKKYVYIEEENKPIECLDFLKSIEKNDKTITPYELFNEYIIKGNDLLCKRNIYGKCQINNLSSFEFYVVSSSWNDYNKSKYYCYDLNSSVQKEIHPQLKSYNGFAKKLLFTLDNSVNKNDDVKVQVNYENKGCLSDKRCYIIADAKYKKLNLNKFTIIIRSKVGKVDNVRIYFVDNNKYIFLCKIFPVNVGNPFYQPNYTSFIHNIDTKLIKNSTFLVYFFDKL